MTRAYYQWPNAWTTWNGKSLKIFEVEVSEENKGWRRSYDTVYYSALFNEWILPNLDVSLKGLIVNVLDIDPELFNEQRFQLTEKMCKELNNLNPRQIKEMKDIDIFIPQN